MINQRNSRLTILTMALILIAVLSTIASGALDYATYFPEYAPTGPRISAAGSVDALAISGTTLCVGTETCIQLYDVSDPTAPVWLADAPVYADRLLASGDMLYAARESYGMYTIDISDPSAPFVTAFDNQEYGTGDFLIHDGYLLISASHLNVYAWLGIVVYDLSDPAYPTLVNETTGSAGFDICKSGDTMFLVSANPYTGVSSYLRCVDISDPADPVYYPDGLEFAGMAHDAEAFGDYLYVVTEANGLYVIDVSDPAVPTIILEMSQYAGAHGVGVVGQSAWLTVSDVGGVNRLITLSLSDPTLPVQIGETTYTGDDFEDAQADGWLYLASGEVSPLLIDIGDLASPAVEPWTAMPVGHVELESAGIAVLDDRLYIGSDLGDALRIFDFSDPQAPVQVGSVSSDLVGGDVVVQDAVLYQMMKDPAVPSNRWFDVYSLADPLNPQKLGRGELGGFSLNLAATPGALYTTLNRRIHVIDVSDPVNPTVAGTFLAPGNGNGRDLLVDGDHLYAPLTSSGLVIYDISSPLSPVLASVVDLPYCFSVDIRGDLAYAADYYDGLVIIDIGDPALPVVLSSLPTPDTARRVLVSDGKAYVQSAYEGWVYDLVSPTAPTLEGIFALASTATELDLIGPWLAMAQDNRGVQFAWRAAGELAPVRERLPQIGNGMTVYPNPFNPCATIRYSLAEPGEVSVDILDLAGRRVARIFSGVRAAGQHGVQWDGRSHDGRAMPSGAYLARVRSAAGVKSSRLTLVR